MVEVEVERNRILAKWADLIATEGRPGELFCFLHERMNQASSPTRRAIAVMVYHMSEREWVEMKALIWSWTANPKLREAFRLLGAYRFYNETRRMVTEWLRTYWAPRNGRRRQDWSPAPSMVVQKSWRA